MASMRTLYCAYMPHFLKTQRIFEVIFKFRIDRRVGKWGEKKQEKGGQEP